MKKYALKYKETGKLLGFYFSSFRANDEFNIPCVLDKYTCDTWFANSLDEVKYVREHSTKGFISDYIHPEHSFKPEELEIVECKITLKTIKD